MRRRGARGPFGNGFAGLLSSYASEAYAALMVIYVRWCIALGASLEPCGNTAELPAELGTNTA